MSPLTSYLVETSVTLIAVIAIAVLILYGAKRFGVGGSSGPLELVGRLPLDARRAVYLIRVGNVVYVVGASEGGMSKLGEVDAEIVTASAPARAATFREVLAKVAGKGEA